MLIENKGVIDNRKCSDSILFLFSLCFPCNDSPFAIANFPKLNFQEIG